MGQGTDLRVARDQNQEQDKRNVHRPGIDVIQTAPKMPKAETPICAAEGENIGRPRGKPAGSKNKPKQHIIVIRDSANAVRAHAMEVTSGCDVNESLANFARRKQLLLSDNRPRLVQLLLYMAGIRFSTCWDQSCPISPTWNYRANNFTSRGSGAGSWWRNSWCTHCF